MSHQGKIDGITEHDLEPPEIFEERSTDPDVPVVQPDSGFDVAAGDEVGIESVDRESVRNH